MQRGEIVFERFAHGRLDSPVKRDAYAEIAAKHADIVKRGEFPGYSHILFKRDTLEPALASAVNVASGILVGDKPQISPAAALDQDGHDISMSVSCYDLT